MWRNEDELQSMLRESVDRYAASSNTMERVREKRRSPDGFDRESWRAMAEAGWTGMLLPESVGGMGLDILTALTISEAVGRNLVPEPILACSVIAASVLAVADSETGRELARSLVAGEAVVVLADQERVGAPHGEKLASILARTADGGLVLTGRKVFVPAWTDRTQLLVSAVLDGEPAVVVVGHDSKGITAEPRRMTDGTVCADVSFEAVELGQESLLLAGSSATDAIELAVCRGMLGLSAQLEGAARRLLVMTSEYVGQRVQFGAPLANFQSIRHALASVHLEIELAGASWRRAAQALDNGSADARFRISAAKARCSDALMVMGKTAVHYHGAFGFTEEADVGLYVNTALRWASWLGSAPWHRRRALQLSRDLEEALAR